MSDKKNFYKTRARKGGSATLKKYGTKHFSELAKKRWAKKKSNNKK